MNNMSKIEKQVMGSVAVIYTARTLASATALKVYALVVSLAGVIAFASVPNVVLNFESVVLHSPSSAGIFIVYAVLSTTVVVQFALAVGAAAFVSLAVSAVKTFFTNQTVTA